MVRLVLSHKQNCNPAAVSDMCMQDLFYLAVGKLGDPNVSSIVNLDTRVYCPVEGAETIIVSANTLTIEAPEGTVLKAALSPKSQTEEIIASRIANDEKPLENRYNPITRPKPGSIGYMDRHLLPENKDEAMDNFSKEGADADPDNTADNTTGATTNGSIENKPTVTGMEGMAPGRTIPLSPLQQIKNMDMEGLIKTIEEGKEEANKQLEKKQMMELAHIEAARISFIPINTRYTLIERSKLHNNAAFTNYGTLKSKYHPTMVFDDGCTKDIVLLKISIDNMKAKTPHQFLNIENIMDEVIKVLNYHLPNGSILNGVSFDEIRGNAVKQFQDLVTNFDGVEKLALKAKAEKIRDYHKIRLNDPAFTIKNLDKETES